VQEYTSHLQSGKVLLIIEKECERERKRTGDRVRKVQNTNARQSGTARRNDPEEENEGQDVNVNVMKARKCCFVPELKML